MSAEINIHKFYRIKNTWDPIDNTATTTTDTPIEPAATSAKATSITASSFIDWKGMYEPKVIFDNKLKIGWLEKSEGYGIGQKITLVLKQDITIDEIKVAPGYFDPRYWKNNNRVKKLKVDYGGSPFAINFKDEMKVQNIKLSRAITFSKITFTVMGVHPSNKDNDTGISEIEFYYQGEKVEIDVSGI